MAIDESPSIRDPAAPLRVTLSRWVNERPPSCRALLTAHDVARLTRRSRWVLETLTLFGRFPRKHRFHGRGIGWLRDDIRQWLELDKPRRLGATKCRTRGEEPAQFELAFGCSHGRASRSRVPCISVRRNAMAGEHNRNHAISRANILGRDQVRPQARSRAVSPGAS